ncbi:hypothetical protein VTO42DRAFT_8857 [Malbranchea cinnamomea]
MEVTELVSSIGYEIEDAEEEAFLLFSQDIPSSNLGFINSRSNKIDVTVRGRDYTIYQSPTVLNSKRQGGTTGAVLWKITPLLAEWICSKDNVLWNSPFLSANSTVIELGCGVSGLMALSMAPLVNHYIATDQEYVQRIFKENLEANFRPVSLPGRTQSDSHQSANSNQRHRSRKSGAPTHSPASATRHSRPRDRVESNGISIYNAGDITFIPLDWETDNPAMLKRAIPIHSSRAGSSRRSPSSARNSRDADVEDLGFDLLLACDCIYNESLIKPFVRTCADICRLRPAYSYEPDQRSADAHGRENTGVRRPTLCIIAQQLRSHEVFEEWVREALINFRVWRLKDEVLGKDLGAGSGYAVHMLLLGNK